MANDENKDLTQALQTAATAPNTEKLTLAERLSGKRKATDPTETPINRSLDAVKNTWAPNNTDITNFISPLEHDEERLVRDFVKVELGYIIRDAIAPYTIDDSYFTGSAVVPFYLKDHFDASVNLHELVLDYMLADRAVYSRVVLNDVKGKKISVVIAREPKVDEQAAAGSIQMSIDLKVGNESKSYPVSHACMVQGTGGNATKRSLLVVFRLLVSLYASLKNVSEFNRKTFLHLEGLSSILDKTSITVEAQMVMMSDIIDQARAILQDDIVILDKNAEIKISPVSFAEAGAIISFIYSEMARILKVPQTKLIGSAPSGLNATGEYDDKNYQDTLNSIRKNVIEPTLEALGYTFHYNHAIEPNDFTLRLKALLEMSERDTTITLEGKLKLALKLLPWLDADDFRFTSEQELWDRVDKRLEAMANNQEYGGDWGA